MAERKKKTPAPVLDPTIRIGNLVTINHGHELAGELAVVISEREYPQQMHRLRQIREHGLPGTEFYADPFFFTKVAEEEPTEPADADAA